MSRRSQGLKSSFIAFAPGYADNPQGGCVPSPALSLRANGKNGDSPLKTGGQSPFFPFALRRLFAEVFSLPPQGDAFFGIARTTGGVESIRVAGGRCDRH